MAFTVGATLAKDSASAAIPGGLLSADVAGGGVGPTFFFHGLVDGIAGVNKGQIDSSSRLLVNIGAAATAIAKAEDVASADADVGVGALAVRKATPANTSGTDGDYEFLQMSAGRLWTNSLIGDGTNAAAIKAASTAPVAADPALVVAISPNSVNANLSDGSAQTSAAHVGAPTIPLDPYSQYETVAASATDQIMGATGAQYDYIAGVLIIPGTSAAGAVSIKDGNGSAISVFAGGGTTALADLKPFIVPLGLHALAGTTPGWKITTGTNVTAVGIGKFT